MISFDIKMNPHAKRRWVSALRSGKYPQGKSALLELDMNDNPAGYCCLGVQAVVESVPYHRSPEGPRAVFTFPNGKTEYGYSPSDWFSQFFHMAPESDENEGQTLSVEDVDVFNRETMIVLADSIKRKLANFNDKGKDFAFIADWIESNL